MSDPMLFLLASACIGTDAAADMFDDHANREAAEASLLAIVGSPGDERLDPHEIEAWRKTGIEFGEPVDGFLRKARLPLGWELRRTEHPMWNDLVDAQGRVRARQFYKSAFWDQRAFVRLVPRFSIQRQCEYEREGEPRRAEIRHVVLDADREIFTTAITRIEIVGDDRMGFHDRMDFVEKDQRDACKQWLGRRYPDYEDVGAHWDEA